MLDNTPKWPVYARDIDGTDTLHVRMAGDKDSNLYGKMIGVGFSHEAILERSFTAMQGALKARGLSFDRSREFNYPVQMPLSEQGMIFINSSAFDALQNFEINPSQATLIENNKKRYEKLDQLFTNNRVCKAIDNFTKILINEAKPYAITILGVAGVIVALPFILNNKDLLSQANTLVSYIGMSVLAFTAYIVHDRVQTNIREFPAKLDALFSSFAQEIERAKSNPELSTI